MPRTSSSTRDRLPVFLGTLAVITAAAVATAGVLDDRDRGSVWGIALTIALVALGFVVRDALPGASEKTVSPAIVPVIALAAMLPGAHAAIVSAAIVASVDVLRRMPVTGIVLNASLIALASVATSTTFELLARLSDAPIAYVLAGVCAGAVYFAVTMGLLWGATVADGEDVAHARRSTLWLLPHYAFYGCIAGGAALGDAAFGAAGVLVFAIPAVGILVATHQVIAKTTADAQQLRETNVQLRAVNANLEQLLSENNGLIARLEEQNRTMIDALVRTIDARDAYTAEHTCSAAAIADQLAIELGLSDASRDALREGAQLHDIGKIGVRDVVLNKPGKLDAEEWAEMQRHPVVAAEILAQLDISPIARSVIVHHHENVDGSGYPEKLTGEQLPIETKIMRVADAFDAMTSSRPYRSSPLPDEAALAELRRGTGTQFDPEVVQAMERLLRRGGLREEQGGQSVAAAD